MGGDELGEDAVNGEELSGYEVRLVGFLGEGSAPLGVDVNFLFQRRGGDVWRSATSLIGYVAEREGREGRLRRGSKVEVEFAVVGAAAAKRRCSSLIEEVGKFTDWRLCCRQVLVVVDVFGEVEQYVGNRQKATTGFGFTSGKGVDWYVDKYLEWGTRRAISGELEGSFVEWLVPRKAADGFGVSKEVEEEMDRNRKAAFV